MAGNLKRTATPPASVSSHSKQLRIYDFTADTSYAPTSALGHNSILTDENDLPIDVILTLPLRRRLLPLRAKIKKITGSDYTIV